MQVLREWTGIVANVVNIGLPTSCIVELVLLLNMGMNNAQIVVGDMAVSECLSGTILGNKCERKCPMEKFRTSRR